MTDREVVQSRGHLTDTTIKNKEKVPDPQPLPSDLSHPSSQKEKPLVTAVGQLLMCLECYTFRDLLYERLNIVISVTTFVVMSNCGYI